MDPEPTTKGGQMAQSAEDVARESIEAITPVTSTGSARFSPTTYEEELVTQRRLEGADAGSRQRRTGSKRFRTSTAR
jgi:hypothetical protein